MTGTLWTGDPHRRIDALRKSGKRICREIPRGTACAAFAVETPARRAEYRRFFSEESAEVPHDIFRRVALLLALPFASFFLLPTGAFPGETAPGGNIPIRCRWNSPNDGSGLDMVFSGNPMIVARAGENLSVAPVLPSGEAGRITLLREGQPFREDASLSFVIPNTPGTYYIPLAVSSSGGNREFELCVVVPYQAAARRTTTGWDVTVDNQPIGSYRHPSRSGNAKVRNNPECYQPPVWWLRITETNASFEVAPGLTAGELVVASDDTGEKHIDLVPVCYPMWLAIGTLRKALEERGIPGRSCKLLSMFRAPTYNRGIGSNAFSRHVYGDAFDFFIDLEDNGMASDLNGDGRLDRRDAYRLVAIIEDLQAEKKIPMGGIGIYNTVAGDCVVSMHLDLRGHRATWCYRTGAGGHKSEYSWASRRFPDLDVADEQAAAERAAKENRKYAPPHREPLQ